ncbi:hypothetical protein GGF37_006601, partial [Kickxella alabastrina]
MLTSQRPLRFLRKKAPFESGEPKSTVAPEILTETLPKPKPKPKLLFARSGAMLNIFNHATGTLNTLLTKLQDKQCVGNCDNPDMSKREYFEQPVWQTLNMFYGEMLCLVCFYLFSLRQRNFNAVENRGEYEAIADND